MCPPSRSAAPSGTRDVRSVLSCTISFRAPKKSARMQLMKPETLTSDNPDGWLSMTRSVLFLIPSYQPTEILCSILQTIRLHDSSPIVVVDDGSGSGHAAIFERVKQMPGTSVLTNAVNLGKGAALKHGMNDILVNHPECAAVVTADADGQHAAADILKVADALTENPDRVVFGTRRFGSDVPLR